jgi:hypothetical protein
MNMFEEMEGVEPLPHPNKYGFPLPELNIDRFKIPFTIWWVKVVTYLSILK